MFNSNRYLKGLLNPVTVLAILTLIIVSYWFVDKALVAWLYPFHFRESCPWLTWVTYLGNSGANLTLFFMVAVFFRYVSKNPLWEQRAWFIWLCIALSNIVCGCLKVILGRARPDLWLQSQEYGFSYLHMDALHMSFPSGHTTTIMSLAFGLSVIFPRFWMLFVSGGLLVALSRVFLLQHYLSDVVAAIYLTLLVVVSLVGVLRKIKCLPKVC